MNKRELSSLRKLLGLEPKAKTWAPAFHPGHSATGKVVTDVKPDWSRYDHCAKLQVAGESYYQDALMAVSRCEGTGRHAFEGAAELVPEPDNPHDKFAVKVMIEGQHVGYLPRGSARRYSKRLRLLREEGRPTLCMAYVGRGDGTPFGCVLRLPKDGEILQGRP